MGKKNHGIPIFCENHTHNFTAKAINNFEFIRSCQLIQAMVILMPEKNHIYLPIHLAM